TSTESKSQRRLYCWNQGAVAVVVKGQCDSFIDRRTGLSTCIGEWVVGVNHARICETRIGDRAAAEDNERHHTVKLIRDDEGPAAAITRANDRNGVFVVSQRVAVV